MTRVLLKPKYHKLLHSLLSSTLISHSLEQTHWLTSGHPDMQVNVCPNSFVQTQDQAFSGAWESKSHHYRGGRVSADKITKPRRSFGPVLALLWPWPVPGDNSGASCWVSGQKVGTWEPSLSACISPVLPCGQSANRLLSKEMCVAIFRDYYTRLSNLCHQTLSGCLWHK